LDKTEEKLFAQHEKQTAQVMKIVVAVLVAILIFTLYDLLQE